VRDSSTVPAPRPDFVFSVGDIAVCVGTDEGLAAVRERLTA